VSLSDGFYIPDTWTNRLNGMFVVIAGLARITKTLPQIYDSVMTSLSLPDYPPLTMKEGPQDYAEVHHYQRRS